MGFFFLLIPRVQLGAEEVQTFGVTYPAVGFGIRSDGFGFHMKIARDLAISGSLSFVLGRGGSLEGHLNGMVYPKKWEITSPDLGSFPLYAGAGIIIGSRGGFLLGMRFPFGVEHHLQGTPLLVFLEFSPFFYFIQFGRGNVLFSSGHGNFGILYIF